MQLRAPSPPSPLPRPSPCPRRGGRYVGELQEGGAFSPKMDHLACFLAGTLALGHQHGAAAEAGEAKNLLKAVEAAFEGHLLLAESLVSSAEWRRGRKEGGGGGGKRRGGRPPPTQFAA